MNSVFVFLLLGTSFLPSCTNKKEPECGDPKVDYLQINLVDVSRQSGKCFDGFSMQDFEYNGTIIIPTNGGQFDYSYRIIKK